VTLCATGDVALRAKVDVRDVRQAAKAAVPFKGLRALSVAARGKRARRQIADTEGCRGGGHRAARGCCDIEGVDFKRDGNDFQGAQRLSPDRTPSAVLKREVDASVMKLLLMEMKLVFVEHYGLRKGSGSYR
jgi:hypothetical protein